VNKEPEASVEESSVESEGTASAATSQFWRELQAEHLRTLESIGPETFKRRQALRYFTWRWSWRTLRKSEQFRFLLTHSRFTDFLRAAVTKTDLGDSSWDGVSWTRPDRWLYCFATRLLWCYAQRATKGHRALALDEPPLGAPLPVQYGGRLISQDLANSVLELSAIERFATAPPQHVLEIGAGYGRTAYLFLSLYENCRYTIIDIEPALTLSKWYLGKLFDSDRLTFLRPEELGRVQPDSVDLAVSISTLSEMTSVTRDEYLRFIDSVTAGGHVYLKQWSTWHNPIDDLLVRFEEFPIPAGWVCLTNEKCPVQTRFVQAMWWNPG
jgi:putative sugar O-methyltransferase